MLFRSISYFLKKEEFNSFLNVRSYCSALSWVETLHYPLTITDDTTIEEIAKSLKDDFEIDSDKFLKLNKPREFWVEKYKYWQEYHEKAENKVMQDLESAFAQILGRMPKEVEGMMTNIAANKKNQREKTKRLVKF